MSASMVSLTMKTMYLLCFIAFFLSPAFAAESGDFPMELKSRQAASSSKEVQDFITKSYEANKSNPAYFVAAANYYWSLSQQTNLSTKPAGPGDFVLADPKTGKAVGSISTSGQVDPALQQKSIALLTEAHSRFPYRLDIGMGLAYLLREVRAQPKCCSTLLDILKYAPKNASKLEWKDGGPLPEPAGEYIPRLMQGYTSSFFKLDTKEGDELCRRLCQRLIQAYPESPFAYNMLAALSDAHGDKKSTIKYLLAAHQKAPKDALVLFNLATTCRASGDNSSALKYFEQVVTLSPDEEMKNSAKLAIAELRK
jgi:tetratricopeptide (TPR) repeat protein